jgi:hypothetical protein
VIGCHVVRPILPLGASGRGTRMGSATDRRVRSVAGASGRH